MKFPQWEFLPPGRIPRLFSVPAFTKSIKFFVCFCERRDYNDKHQFLEQEASQPLRGRQDDPQEGGAHLES